METPYQLSPLRSARISATFCMHCPSCRAARHRTQSATSNELDMVQFGGDITINGVVVNLAPTQASTGLRLADRRPFDSLPIRIKPHVAVLMVA